MKSHSLINIIAKKDKLFGFTFDGNRTSAVYLGLAEYCLIVKADRIWANDTSIVGWRDDGDGFTRLIFRDYDAREAWKNAHKGQLEIFEGFSPARQYLVDHPEVAVEVGRPVIVDIETDSRAGSVEDAIAGHTRIVCIALYAENFQWQGCIDSDTDQSECEMLTQCWEQLAHFDHVIGWNSDEFDQLVLTERSKRYKIWPDRRLLWLDAMHMHKRMDQQGQGSGENKSAALNAVAQAKLGYGKHDYDTSDVWDDWKAGGERRALMLRYNMQDAKLVWDILQKTGYLESFRSICETCRVFCCSHMLKPTPQLDGWLATFARKRGTRIPAQFEPTSGATENFEGAFVMDPTVSVAENVHVADFAALYPSIMRTLNICWTTKSPDGEIEVPEVGIRFKDSVEGLIPAALANFADNREIWKAKKKAATPGTDEYFYADRRQMVPKLLSNSTYGVLANVYSRYVDIDLAKSVTATGRWLIKLVMDEARRWGLSPLYGDTDSIMINGCTRERFAEFINHCNNVVFPGELMAIGCSRNFINLDFVETFSKIVYTAAKRYAGRFSLYAGQPINDYAIEIKGLEFRRGDGNRLARQMQEEAVHIILGGWSYCGDIEKFVLDWRARIFEQPIPAEDVAISKGVKEHYSLVNKNGRKMSLPAQARVAAELRERGKRPFKVSYVITDASVSPMEIIPVEDYTGVEADRYYLWEAVYSPTMRLLAAAYPDRNWMRFQARRPRNKPLAGQLGLDFA